MERDPTQFEQGVIRPLECLSEAWALIQSRYWLFLGIVVVGILLGSLVAIVLMGPMMCGIYYCFLRQMKGERVQFEELFRGFDYFVQSLIATLIQTIPVVVLAVPLYLIMVVGIFASMSVQARNGGEALSVGFLMIMIALWALLVILCGLIIGVFCMFVYPLIVDRKLSAIDALKTSAAAALANLGGVIKLALLNIVLSFAGLLLCYVGAFFIMPVTLMAQAIAYRRLFPAMDESGSVGPPIVPRQERS